MRQSPRVGKTRGDGLTAQRRHPPLPPRRRGGRVPAGPPGRAVLDAQGPRRLDDPQGRIEEGEEPRDCALRELGEELGRGAGARPRGADRAGRGAPAGGQGGRGLGGGGGVRPGGAGQQHLRARVAAAQRRAARVPRGRPGRVVRPRAGAAADPPRPGGADRPPAGLLAATSRTGRAAPDVYSRGMENGSTPPSADTGAADQNGHLPLSARLLGVGVRGARTRRQGDRDRPRRRSRRRGGDRRRGRERGGRAGDGPGARRAGRRRGGAGRAARARRSRRRCSRRWTASWSTRSGAGCWPARRRSSWSSGSPRHPRCGPRSAPRAPACSRTSAARSASSPAASTTRFERIVRRIFFRRRRPLPTDHAGAGQPRPGVLSIDGVFVNLGFTAVVALVTPGRQRLRRQRRRRHQLRDRGRLDRLARARRALPGRLLVAGRADAGDALPRHPAQRGRLPLRRSLRRLVGLGLSVVTFGFGFLGVVFRERRRAWEDRSQRERRRSTTSAAPSRRPGRRPAV